MVNDFQSEKEKYAYSILLQRHINDDRLMRERSSIYLACNSLLFLGLVNLTPNTILFFKIIIIVIGLAWSFIAIISNHRTKIGLDFWEEHEKTLETKGSSFAYMRENKMTPHLVYEEIKKKNCLWLETDYSWLARLRNRDIYAYILPSLFIILWISSLIWVIIN